MQGHRYRVRKGDSLSSIAQSQLGTAKRWPRLFAYNNRRDVSAYTGRAIKDPNRLVVGQLLLIPPPDHAGGRPSHAADRRQPRQATRPSVPAATQPATDGGPAAPKPASAPPPAAPAGAAGQQPAGPSGGSPGAAPAAPGGDGGGTVNSFPFKYKLDVIPKQTVEGPNYIATVKFEGQVTIWLDRQIPIATLSNKGLELAAKHDTDGVFARLVQNEKVSWDPGSNKASYENMLTVNAHGAPPSLSSVGVAVESDNPVPALRFKFQAPTLQGKLGQHLFVAENFVATVDLRPKPDDPDITRRPDPVLATAPQRAPQPSARPEPWYARAGHWAWDHKVDIGVGVVVTAVIASNFVTAGADGEADIPVAAWAARTLQAARAARAAGALAPAFAH